MSITAEQLELAGRLRQAGASAYEVAEVLLATAEVDAIIELAAWQHELRSHGKFASSGGGSRPSPAAKAALRSGRAHTTMESESRLEARTAEVMQAHTELKQLMAQAQKAHDDLKAEHAKLQSTTTGHIAEVKKQAAEAEKTEGHTMRVKLVSHLGIAAAGAVIAGIEAKLGTPDLVMMASSMAPIAAQEITDFVKRLG